MRTSPALDSIMSKTRQRLMAAFLVDPKRSWYGRDLARHLKLAPSTLQRDLKRLQRGGVVRTWRDGNRVYFQADAQSPIYPDLRSLLVKTVGVVDVVREELQPLQKTIRVAAIYGSMATGTETTASDVDLLVVGAVDFADLSAAVAKVSFRLLRPLNPRLYSEAEFRRKASAKAGSHFIHSILAKPMLFVIGMRSDLETIIGGTSRRAGANGSKRH